VREASPSRGVPNSHAGGEKKKNENNRSAKLRRAVPDQKEKRRGTVLTAKKPEGGPPDQWEGKYKLLKVKKKGGVKNLQQSKRKH